MRALADRVRRTIRAHQLLDRRDRVLAALSGGSDSVALVLLLAELAEAGDVTLAGLAHVNHQLRPTALRDERFCRDFATRLSLPLEVIAVDVRDLARERRVSIEVAARDARYAALEAAADGTGATRIAVGHTRDDQAETFLLRLLRGAGPRGLAGIRPRVGRVVRPLLDLGRGELRDWLDASGERYCEDETNRDLAVPRNRVRHEVLPLLARHLSPDVWAVLARAAAIARDESDLLEKLAIESAAGIVLADTGSDTGVLELDADRLLSLHPALARRVAHHVLECRAGGRFVGFDHAEALVELARAGREGARLDLPGLRARRAGGRIQLGQAGPPPAGSLAEARSLPVPGVVELPELGWRIASGRADSAPGGVQYQEARSLEVFVDAGGPTPPLAVRTRRPGDALRPLGLGGRKKLQDLFVDRKVPRAERDRVPLVVDARDRIVWVVGETVAEDFRVTSPLRAVIFLKASRLGGQG